MHIPDGFLNNQVSVGLIATSIVVGGYALKKAKDLLLEKTKVLVPQLVTNIGTFNKSRLISRLKWKSQAGHKIQQMILVFCMIFTGQMLDLPVMSGGTVHLIGGVLAALVLGPWLGLLIMTAVLTVQAVFLADGGIMALGANIFNMGIITSVGGYYLYQLGKKIFRNKYLNIAIISWLSVVGAAVFYSLETMTSLSSMVLIHAIGGVLEAVITILALKFLFKQYEK